MLFWIPNNVTELAANRGLVVYLMHTFISLFWLDENSQTIPNILWNLCCLANNVEDLLLLLLYLWNPHTVDSSYHLAHDALQPEKQLKDQLVVYLWHDAKNFRDKCCSCQFEHHVIYWLFFCHDQPVRLLVSARTYQAANNIFLS